MANVRITSSGSYTVGDGDKVKIDIPGGGTVTLVAPSGGDKVDKFTIELENNDDQSDVVTVDLSTFDEDLHIDIKEYDPSDQVILKGATITGLDPDNPSKLEFTYEGEDGETYSGYAHLKDKDENDLSGGDNGTGDDDDDGDGTGDDDDDDDDDDSGPPLIICFAKGTKIRSNRGEVPIEALRPGDRIHTRDDGQQKIRWIGQRHLSALDLARHPSLRPILIKAGALGTGLPRCDLRVSPQHRLCLSGAQAILLFGCETVLVAAKHLVNDQTIFVDHATHEVTYFHLLFDRHQVIFADGAPSESLFPGDMALSAMDQMAQDEVLTLFPELAASNRQKPNTAHLVLKAHEAKVMLGYVA